MLSAGGVDRTGCLEDEVGMGKEEKKCITEGLSEHGNRAACVGKSPRLGLGLIRISAICTP